MPEENAADRSNATCSTTDLIDIILDIPCNIPVENLELDQIKDLNENAGTLSSIIAGLLIY